MGDAKKKLRTVVGVAAAAVAIGWAGTSHAQGTYYPPQGTWQPAPARTQERDITPGPNRRLLVAGATAFGVAYVPSVAVGIFSDRSSNRALLVPVVGPWIALGGFDCTAEQPCGRPGLDRALMLTSGILQGAGAIAMAASIFIPDDESMGPLEAIPIGKAKVRLTPVAFGRSGGGIGALATF